MQGNADAPRVDTPNGHWPYRQRPAGDTTGVRAHTGSVAATSGLTTAQADVSRAEHGRNVLPQPRRPSPLRRLIGQLVHFFAIMLWVAAGLAFVAGMPQLGIAIIAVVVLNAVFAFVQEGRADRAAERLRCLLPSAVTVVRDGRQRRIEATDVVVGDLVVLEAGDRVPADATVLRATALSLDTSMLTGESRASHASVDDALFAGTFVVEGDALARVTGVGGATRLAAISQLTTLTPKPVTPLARELQRVVRMIAVRVRRAATPASRTRAAAPIRRCGSGRRSCSTSSRRSRAAATSTTGGQKKTGRGWR